MFEVNGNQIKMTEGDYGITLPIEIEFDETTVVSSVDIFRITIYTRVNSAPIITKSYTPLQNNTIQLKFTQAESQLLTIGRYLYDLDWYDGTTFMCNILKEESFIVTEKAGLIYASQN